MTRTAKKWRPLSFRKVGKFKLIRHGTQNVIGSKHIVVKEQIEEDGVVLVKIIARVQERDTTRNEPTFMGLPKEVQEAIEKMFAEGRGR